MDLNLNSVQCIKGIKNIGETTYKNICTNTLTSVPWGVQDWLNVLFGIVFFGIVIYLLIRILNE